MTRRFDEIYEDLYSDYVYEYRFETRMYYSRSEHYILRDMRSAIESAEIETKRLENFQNITVRSDARFFLLVNIHQMFLRPILLSDTYKNSISSSDELSRLIKKDIKTIIKEAFEEAKRTQKNEISGHIIMTTVDQNWKNLNLTSFKVWGDVD